MSKIKTQASYPSSRLRRNRKSEWSRRLVQENQLLPSDLIWPIFVCEGQNNREKIDSMPGVERQSVDLAVTAAKQAEKAGIPVIALFPSTPKEKRSDDGAEALNSDNLVCRAVKEIKDKVPDIGIMCDVALDPYTSHGHDGLLIDGVVHNDATIEVLVAQALTQAKAGCDILGPSDMMDGRVGAIRHALETEGFHDTQIMAYSAKYASGFYGPFRDAVGSNTTLKSDKKTYQMNYGNAREALLEAELDAAEGADMLMVKPGMPYLDIITRLAQTNELPVFAYQVSGEYAMIMAAIERGWLDGERVIIESLTAFKRAGAAGVLSYFALDVAQNL